MSPTIEKLRDQRHIFLFFFWVFSGLVVCFFLGLFLAACWKLSLYPRRTVSLLGAADYLQYCPACLFKGRSHYAGYRVAATVSYIFLYSFAKPSYTEAWLMTRQRKRMDTQDSGQDSGRYLCTMIIAAPAK